MNLLTFQNRFANHSATDMQIGEINGYTQCLADLLAYVQDKTNFDPSKRMLDAVDLLDCIQDTNAEVMKIAERASSQLITKVTLSGGKVDEFLKENVPAAHPDDLKDIKFS